MAITTRARVKLYLRITDTSSDDLIDFLIPLVESDFLRIRNKEFDTDIYDEIVYPEGSELTAIKMIAYHLYNSAVSGKASIVKSESLSRHSITFNDLVEAYPGDLVKSIQRWDTMTPC